MVVEPEIGMCTDVSEEPVTPNENVTSQSTCTSVDLDENNVQEPKGKVVTHAHVASNENVSSHHMPHVKIAKIDDIVGNMSALKSVKVVNISSITKESQADDAPESSVHT